MRSCPAHIAVLLAVFMIAAGCTHRARMISDRKLKRIYFEMFVADQWLRDNPSARAQADTSLFFEPIFRKYGFTFEDYAYTVSQKVKSPEAFSALLSEVSDELKKVSDEDKKIIDAREAIDAEIRKLAKYKPQDFCTDSSRWEGPQTLWPVYVEQPLDSISVAKDSSEIGDRADRLVKVFLDDSLTVRVRKEAGLK